MASNKKQPKTVSAIVSSASRAIYTGRLVRSCMVWLAVVLSVGLLFFLLDNYLHLPAEIRMPLSIISLALAGYTLLRYVVKPYFARSSSDEVALEIEEKFELKDNILINSLQFESRDSIHGKFRLRQFEKPFAATTIAQAINISKGISPSVLKNSKLIRLLVTAVVCLGVGWLAYGIVNTRLAANAMSRFIKPLADIPPAGMVDVKIEPFGDIVVAEGDDLEVMISLVSHHDDYQLKKYPEIVWSRDVSYIDITPPGIKSSDANVRPVNAIDGEPWKYKYVFKNIRHNMAFRVFAADTYSSSVRILVNKVPRVSSSEFFITPPDYTGISMAKLDVVNNELAVLPDTKVTMHISLDKPVENMQFEYQGKTVLFEGKEKDFTLDFVAAEMDSYTIKADYRTVGKIVDILSGSIVPALDSPPYVEFETDKLSIAAVPGQRINLPVKVTDDYGLSRCQLTIEQADSDIEPEVIKNVEYEGPPGQKQAVEKLLLTLDAHKYQPGTSYIVRAEAWDYCPEMNNSFSRPLVITVRSLDDIMLAPDDPAVGAFELLDKAIEAQKDALGAAQNIAANLEDIISGDDAEARNNLIQHRDSLQQKQNRVGEFLRLAWDRSPVPRPDFVAKMDSINKGEQARTLSKIVVLASQRKPDISMTERSLKAIADLQQYILDKLIALKAAAALQSEKDIDAAEDKGDGELDDSIHETFEDSLNDFATELDNFVITQKTIIHDRDMIMDKPAEDFSEDDVDNLAKLAIDQSRLAEVLANAVNDFTNLDLQDFGDPDMVEKMSSIYQAADDLVAKADQAADDRIARVDAYRLETEAVEMAEEILINCEATLGYYDGIQFIAEIAEDEQLFAPLAELPDELEDLVGDLISSEQEMAEEVEDIGSYLNSLDHTAGPVSDGTISSLSAKGKTGDQKPEDNVIQGRSGAGRSGMSDGQLVESVAKDLHDNEYGLRERTSSTPLESGDVRDEDEGAQTGGTGLGKMTDQASIFGPGGKLPPAVLQKMRAAAAQQQAITSSARQLIPRLRRHNLSTAELEDAVSKMQALENELVSPKTGPGLRRVYNQTLDSLQKSQHKIGDQVQTRYIEKAMGGKRIDLNQQDETTRYKGYERVINAYFEALAK